MPSNQELSPSVAVMTRGVISGLRTVVWTGEMTGPSKKAAGIDFSLGSELKYLLPSTHLGRIRSLVSVRRRAFNCYTLGCSWGRFMPARAIEPWMSIESRFSARLSELAEIIDSDRRYIADSVKVRARARAMELWRKKGNKGEATVPFCMSIENLLLSLVPEAGALKKKYRFATDYHAVPPVSFGSMSDETVASIMDAHYGPVMEHLSSIFVREIMTDLKSRVIEACETLKKNEGKTTGRIRESSLKRFESFLDVLGILWSSADGKVDGAIKGLQEELEKCYTDHDLIMQKVDSLLELASETLDASKLGM